MKRLAIAAGLVVSVIGSAAHAGDEKRACLSSYEAAQRARHKGALVAAQKELAQCTRPACPEILRRDCVSWSAEVERAIPSVVFSVRADGSDVSDVRVLVDDKLVAERIDDVARPLDPGRHVVRFELGALTVTREISLADGQKRQRVEATFESLVLPPPAPRATATPDEPEKETKPARPIPTLAIALGAAGALAIGAGAYFEVQGLAKKGELDTCRPFCAQEQVDVARRSFFMGDLLFAIGGASLGAGVLAYFFFPPSSPIKVEPSPTGARLRFEAVF